MERNVNVIGKRFLAYVIDYLIGYLLVALPIMVIGLLTDGNWQATSLSQFSIIYQLILLVITVGIAILYYVILPYFNNGQTLGKKLVNIKIVSQDDNSLTIKQLLLREVVGIFLLEGNLYKISSVIRIYLAHFTGFRLMVIVTNITMLITTITCVVVLVHKQHYALHDVIGKTEVCAE